MSTKRAGNLAHPLFLEYPGAESCVGSSPLSPSAPCWGRYVHVVNVPLREAGFPPVYTLLPPSPCLSIDLVGSGLCSETLRQPATGHAVHTLPGPGGGGGFLGPQFSVSQSESEVGTGLHFTGKQAWV